MVYQFCQMTASIRVQLSTVIKFANHCFRKTQMCVYNLYLIFLNFTTNWVFDSHSLKISGSTPNCQIILKYTSNLFYENGRQNSHAQTGNIKYDYLHWKNHYFIISTVPKTYFLGSYFFYTIFFSNKYNLFYRR